MNGRQYTIRDVPAAIDRALRQRAKQEGKSLNTVVLETLHQALGQAATPKEYTDLDGLIGSWQEDPEFERALQAFEQVDETCGLPP